MGERKGVMLATKINIHRLQTWQPPFIVQPKLNGLRGRVVIWDGVPVIYSSQGNEFKLIPHINAEFARYVENDKLPSNCIIDGECYVHGMSLDDIKSIVKRTVSFHPLFALMQFHIFDFITDQPQLLRSKELDILPKNNPILKPVHTEFIDTADKALDRIGSFMMDGYEGIIIRNADALYVPRKVTTIYKYKPRQKDEYQIVGCVEEISKDGIPKNALGSFICKKDNQFFNVGTGPELTRENRERYWSRIEDWESGRFIAVVKYQELTPGRQVPFNPVVVEVKEVANG